MLYKFTGKNLQTYDIQQLVQWAIGEWHEAHLICPTGKLIKAYESPLIATFMHVVDHVPESTSLGLRYKNYSRLFEAEGDGVFSDKFGHLHCGVQKLKLIKECDPPVITSMQRARVAILCAKHACEDQKWLAWANDWLAKKSEARIDDTMWKVFHATTRRAMWYATWAACSCACEWYESADVLAVNSVYASKFHDIDLNKIITQAIQEE